MHRLYSRLAGLMLRGVRLQGKRNVEVGRDPPTLGLLCHAWVFGLGREVMESC